jgi:hypothetical protein
MGLHTMTLNELKSVLLFSAQIPHQAMATSQTPPGETEKINDSYREQ